MGVKADSLGGDLHKVVVSAGLGVTSQGYLYCNHSEAVFNTALSIGNYSSKKLKNLNIWTDGEITATATNTFTNVLELKKTANGKLTTADLSSKVLLIVFERTSEKRNGCTTCKKGTNGSVKIRFLLVSQKEWADFKLNDCMASSSTPRQDKPFFPKLSRFGSSESCASNFQIRIKQHSTINIKRLLRRQKQNYQMFLMRF